MHVCAHLQFLRDSFDGNKEKFVTQHQRLLKLVVNFTHVFEPIIFTQFLMSSMQLCVLGFQLVVLQSLYQRLVVTFFAIAIIIQLFIYCYGGQNVMDKTAAVADHFYQTDKDFIIIIARANMAAIVKAGFYRATLETLYEILKTAASLITLLKSFT